MNSCVSNSYSRKRKLHISKLEVSGRTLLASFRYKPEDGSEHPTDRYGYTQTELQPIMTLRNLSEEEIAQVKEFVEDTMAEETIHATREKSISDKIKEKIENSCKPTF